MRNIYKAALILMLCLMMGHMCVSAKGISGKIQDDQGHTYIVKDGKIQYGFFRYKGNYYYGYKKSTRWHRRGTLARDCHKIVQGKWYYFTHSGKVQKHDSDHIDVRHRDYTVKYIYVTPCMRYSAALKRYQIKKKGKWVEMGMQFNWDCDHQP